ncbi:MAG TPA: hypothetical protein VJ576_02630 [Rhodocyclaceae bacterium]|nr:hypothetical protein [Rhodocyclaceae bacterium]
MNARLPLIHVHGDAGAVINTPRADVTINQNCPGPEFCPHRVPLGSPDAKEENEFCKDTGIRTGPTARRLLIELQARHGLKWRGHGSISRMWKHHTLQYIDGRPELHINPSWAMWAYGWVVFSFSALTELILAVLVIWGNVDIRNIWAPVAAVLWLSLGAFVMWVSAEHMISPENTARRLLKLERQRNQ